MTGMACAVISPASLNDFKFQPCASGVLKRTKMAVTKTTTKSIDIAVSIVCQ